MRTSFLGAGGAVVLVAALGLASCGSEAPATTATTIRIGATNFVTLPPTQSTAPVATNADVAAGTRIEGESTYVVQADDYPSTVPAKFRVSYQEFMALNGFVLDSRGFLPGWEPGITVKIPAGATVPGSSGASAAGTATTVAGTPATATTGPAQAATGTSAPVATTAEVCASDEPYTIQAGDAPATVAQKFDTTVAALNASNGGTRGYTSFQVGIQIKIPVDC